MSVPAHLWLAHFPVALLLTGAAADVAGAALRSERVRRLATVLLVLGAAFAVAAFLAGQGALFHVRGRLSPGDPRLDAHTQWGGAGVWALAAAGVLRALWRDRLDGARGWAALAAALLSGALVVAIVATGLAIAHG